MPRIVLRAAVALVLAVTATAALAEGAPLANVSPQFVDYGPVRIGQPITVPVTVRNLTTSTMTFAGGGFNVGGAFSASTGTCGGGLAPGATCAFNYVFRPNNNTGEPLTAMTSVSVIAGGKSQQFPLSFRGTGFGTLVTIVPQTIDFGDHLIGETVTVPMTVHNPLPVAVSFAGGGFNTGTGFTANTGTCGGSLAAGASCNFNYNFTASGLGEFTNQTSLSTITTAPVISQQTPIQVKGTGINTVPLVQMVPLGVGFGKVKQGSRVQVPFKFTNLTAGVVNWGGGGFSVESNDGNAFQGTNTGGVGCASGTANAGSTCTITYSFRPRELRDHVASTGMSFSRPGQSQFVDFDFTGTGVGTLARVGPIEFDFGEVAIGTDMTVKVRVLNDGDLDIENFIGGNVVGQGFSMTTTCTAEVAPGDFCEFSYRFIASQFSIGAHDAQTLISFNNSTGLQGTYEINMRAEAIDRLFRDSFGSGASN
jgi:hypothetical protein